MFVVAGGVYRVGVACVDFVCGVMFFSVDVVVGSGGDGVRCQGWCICPSCGVVVDKVCSGVLVVDAVGGGHIVLRLLFFFLLLFISWSWCSFFICQSIAITLKATMNPANEVPKPGALPSTPAPFICCTCTSFIYIFRLGWRRRRR